MQTCLVLLQITKQSFLAIMKLPNLQVLTLEGCIGIDDGALAGLDKECSKSLQVRPSPVETL
jgi:F-box/leucine-rich repeat protein 2/20